MFTKQDIAKAIVLIWVIGSAAYIIYDTWNDYKIQGVQQAYQNGFNASTKQIFDKVQESQCKSIEVTFQGNKLELIDVGCIQQQSPAGQSQPGTLQNQPTSTKK
jgi:hypothetical protein